MKINEAQLKFLREQQAAALGEGKGLIDPKDVALVEAPLQRWGQKIDAARTARFGEAASELSPAQRGYVALMLDAQYRHMAREAAAGTLTQSFRLDETAKNNFFDRAARAKLAETTTGSDIATYTQQVLAFVEPIFERIMIGELITMRAMQGPTAFVHTLDYKQDSAGTYTSGTSFQGRLDVDYADCPTECNESKGADLSLVSTLVTAECKRLKSSWELIAEQDYLSQHGRNLGADLRSFLQLELMREKQGEVLQALVAGAAYSGVWASTIPVGSVYNNLDPKVYAATLYDAIEDGNNAIFKSQYREANWIAGDPDSLTRLRKLKQFSITENSRVPRGEAGTGEIDEFSNFFGVANMQYRLWKFPFMSPNTLLLGIKSDAPQEVGFIHAEYIPVQDLGIFLDPATACLRTGVQSRYANVMIRSGAYATVSIT